MNIKCLTKHYVHEVPKLAIMKGYTVIRSFLGRFPRQAAPLSKSTEGNGFLYIFPRICYVDKICVYMPIFFYPLSYR